MLHLAQDLKALGWRVEVLAPHAPGAAVHEVLDGVSVTRFRYLWPERAQTVCYQGGALINLRQRKSNWLKLPALVLCEWWALIRLLARCRFDLIQAHWILPQGLVAVAAAALARVPVVVTAHGSDVFGLRSPIMTWCKRLALRRAASITVNSSATMRAVAEIAGGAEKIRVIPMGASVRVTKGREAVWRQYRRGRGPLLVFVGRLVEEKGIGDLIETVVLLAPQMPDITALVVGEGQDRVAFERLAARRGVADRFAFIGWIDADQIPDILAAADIFVGPSKTAPDGRTEGMGLVFAEAMLSGTPVIATRSGGIVDLVRHEQTGLLVSEAAPEEIAGAIKRLMADAELRDRLTQQGRAFAAANYTRERSAQAFADLFATLCQASQFTKAP